MSPLTSPHKLAPLLSHCVFQSGERLDVHAQVAHELSDHALRWRRGEPDAAMHKGQTDHLHAYLLRYGAEVEVRPHLFRDFSLVHTTLAGGMEIEVDGQHLYLGQGRSAVLSPSRELRLHWQPGTLQLIVRVPHALVREVSGMPPSAPVDLGPCQVFTQQHATLWNLQAEALLGALSLPPDSPMRAAWLTHFERSVATFVLGQAGGRSPQAATGSADPIVVPSGPPPARQLDAVIDYVDAHLAAPLSLEDLARAGGMSVRALHQKCADAYGVPPMTWLRQRRLDAARRHLLLNPEVNVADTALAVGFCHVGRFASYYRERFGELPSQTQAHARRGGVA